MCLLFHILGIVIPTDELIFFRGVAIPPTSIALMRVDVGGYIVSRDDRAQLLKSPWGWWIFMKPWDLQVTIKTYRTHRSQYISMVCENLDDLEVPPMSPCHGKSPRSQPSRASSSPIASGVIKHGWLENPLDIRRFQ